VQNSRQSTIIYFRVTKKPVIFFFVALLLLAAYIVFRKIVRRDYLTKGGLTWLSSLLQLLIFVALMCFPYLYNPPEWPWFWKLDGATWNFITGFGLIILGFFVAFGTMLWFGLPRAFGFKSSGIIHTGPYRLSRNPQIIGGYLLVIGASLQWSSFYSLLWIALYGITAHMMIVTEEEYLSQQYGASYTQYCEGVARYLWWNR